MKSIIERGKLPPEALQSQPQRGYQEMKVIMSAGTSIVEYIRANEYNMTELESDIIDVIKARFDSSFELDEPDNTACFEYQQELLRQKRIDKAVDGYLTPDNNKPRRVQEDSEQSCLTSTDIACLIMSAVMGVVLLVGYFLI